VSISKKFGEVYYVDPGYKIFNDYYIIGVPPVAMGVSRKGIALHLRQACHGTFVMGIDSEEEIARLRQREAEKVKASLKKGGPRGKAEPIPSSFSDIWKR